MRERQRISTGEISHAQARPQSKVRRIAPEPRTSALVPEEKRGLAELVQQLAEQPPAAEEPLARPPGNDAGHPQRVGFAEQLANRTAVLESLGRTEDQDFQSLAARHLAPRDDEEPTGPIGCEDAALLGRRD